MAGSPHCSHERVYVMGLNLTHPTSKRLSQLNSLSIVWLLRGNACNLCRERGLLTNSSCISKTCLLRFLNFFVQLFSRSLLYLCLSEPRDRSSATLLNASWQKSHFCTLKCSSRVPFCIFLILQLLGTLKFSLKYALLEPLSNGQICYFSKFEIFVIFRII